MKTERRRFPRVRVDHHPHLPPDLLDVGLGGFSMVMGELLPFDTVQELGLTLGGGREIVVRARVAYCRPERRADGRTVFITGLEFLEDMTADQGLLAAS